MSKLRPTGRFEKDVKRLKKRGYDMALLSAVLEGTLPNERGALLAAARESLRGETPPEK